MKRSVLFTVVGVFALLLPAGPTLDAQSLKGMSLNGATGLIGIPTGRIGWEHSADFGFDLGYHAIFDDGDTAHIPKASISLFKMLEFALAYDTNRGDDNEDLLISAKFQLPTQGTAVALGGNFQMLQINGNDENAQQIYIAATYPGQFFRMPAETTFVVGKTFGDIGPGDEAIDFGMGFDLVLFPDIFQGYVHWINDFANFSYSLTPVGANASDRGSFNTGLRIDLASHPGLSRYKFVIDAILTDALDENRAFALGLAFGAPIR
ncbi:MAG: hypothetical protein EA427_05700 [Spirochaetaceae bacterium]|nr:MAG: hypothetical protein EA427_05700 [Spirochaetaceae bacterium]